MIITNFPDYHTAAATLSFADRGVGDNDGSMYTHVVHLAAAISVAKSMRNLDKYERVNYRGSRKVFNWIRGYNDAILYSSTKGGGAGDGGGGGGGGGGVKEHHCPACIICKVVTTLSVAIYGDPDPHLLPLRESAPYRGLLPYAGTKYRMEGLMDKFIKLQLMVLGTVALHFFNVYRPRQEPKNPYSGAISLLLKMARGGRILLYWEMA
jgi:nucleoside-diphosphate-sugar epimerase